MPIFVFLSSSDGINKIDHVTAKRELFGGSFQVLGADVFLRFGIRALGNRRETEESPIHRLGKLLPSGFFYRYFVN